MFIFYDTETSGLSRDFSQIIQVAMVFTDDDFNILSSKKMECRRNPWVVPSPGSMLITGFSPDDLKNNKLSHFDMMRELDTWLRGQHWPVTFTGYNIFGFDEKILSQNLRQNLLDGGLTTAGNNVNAQINNRCDVFNIVKAVFAYRPGTLTLQDKNEYGSVTLALGAVAAQNGVGIPSEELHDAMNDVKLTVSVAKCLKKIAPRIWDHMLSLSAPQAVDAFIAENPVFTHATVTRGVANISVTTGVTDGFLFNLAEDPTPYLDMKPEMLRTVLLNRRQNIFRRYNRNEQPILMGMDIAKPVLPAYYDQKLYAKRARMIADHPDFAKNLAAAQASFGNAAPATPQAALPELQNKEIADPDLREKMNAWMAEFHAAVPDWKAAAKLVYGFGRRFAEEIKTAPEIRHIANMAGRIVFQHAPETLGADKVVQMKKFIAKRILNPDTTVDYMTVAKARQELLEIEKSRAEENSKWKNVSDSAVRTLKLYYTAIEKEYAPYYVPDKKPANNNPPPAGNIKTAKP